MREFYLCEGLGLNMSQTCAELCSGSNTTVKKDKNSGLCAGPGMTADFQSRETAVHMGRTHVTDRKFLKQQKAFYFLFHSYISRYFIVSGY